jgi:hypothetical protein
MVLGVSFMTALPGPQFFRQEPALKLVVYSLQSELLSRCTSVQKGTVGASSKVGPPCPSRQFGRMSAPMLPHFVRTIFGPNVGSSFSIDGSPERLVPEFARAITSNADRAIEHQGLMEHDSNI